MGILNINNESFYSNSRHVAIDDVERTFVKMVADGADIIDIGVF